MARKLKEEPSSHLPATEENPYILLFAAVTAGTGATVLATLSLERMLINQGDARQLLLLTRTDQPLGSKVSAGMVLDNDPQVELFKDTNSSQKTRGFLFTSNQWTIGNDSAGTYFNNLTTGEQVWLSDLVENVPFGQMRYEEDAGGAPLIVYKDIPKQQTVAVSVKGERFVLPEDYSNYIAGGKIVKVVKLGNFAQLQLTDLRTQKAVLISLPPELAKHKDLNQFELAPRIMGSTLVLEDIYSYDPSTPRYYFANLEEQNPQLQPVVIPLGFFNDPTSIVRVGTDSFDAVVTEVNEKGKKPAELILHVDTQTGQINIYPMADYGHQSMRTWPAPADPIIVASIQDENGKYFLRLINVETGATQTVTTGADWYLPVNIVNLPEHELDGILLVMSLILYVIMATLLKKRRK